MGSRLDCFLEKGNRNRYKFLHKTALLHVEKKDVFRCWMLGSLRVQACCLRPLEKTDIFFIKILPLAFFMFLHSFTYGPNIYKETKP
jgi:hypothetical protein